MSSFVTWEYINQFETDRIRGFVSVEQQPLDLKANSYSHGVFDLEELRGLMELAQTDHHALVDSLIEKMLIDYDLDVWSTLIDEIAPSRLESKARFSSINQSAITGMPSQRLTFRRSSVSAKTRRSSKRRASSTLQNTLPMRNSSDSPTAATVRFSRNPNNSIEWFQTLSTAFEPSRGSKRLSNPN